jgi:hypothetical protein
MNYGQEGHMNNATTDGPRMIQDETTLRAHVAALDGILFGDPAKQHSDRDDHARAAWNAFDDLVEEVLVLRRQVDAVPELTPLGEQVVQSSALSGRDTGDETDHDDIPFGAKPSTRIRALSEPSTPSDGPTFDPTLLRRHNRRGHALAAIQSAVTTLLDSDECIPPTAALHFLCAILDVCVKARAFDGSIPSVANAEAGR